MVGVILAAGDGTRLKKSGNENSCKPLTKINNKYLITYALDNLSAMGIDKAYIVVGKEGDLIKNTLNDDYKGISLYYVTQKEQKGLVDAFAEALKVLDGEKSVVLQLSDEILIDLKTTEIRKSFEGGDCDFYCGVVPEENTEKIKNNFSVETDEKGRLVKCIEKPKNIINNVKGTGFTVFNGRTQLIIREQYEKGNLIDLCDCFNYLVAEGYYGVAYTIAEREFNINALSDLNEAENYLSK